MPMSFHGDNDEDGGNDDVHVHDDGESGASNSTHWTKQKPRVSIVPQQSTQLISFSDSG